MRAITITSAFDGGNILVKDASDPGNIRLAIRPDNASDFYQWFYFRLTGGQGQACCMVIENAKDAAYIGGWDGYRICASYDRETWFRIPETRYENGQLIINHTPERGSIYKNIWVIARQHPGETMAEWWMEGFLARLLDDSDAAAIALRRAATFHIIPNMNPDGSRHGNLRTNHMGANLNREWGVATQKKSPEVLCTIAAMDENPPALCLDVHGDESLPYNFIAGAEGIPGYSNQQAANLDGFLESYKKASSDFQTQIGYPKTAPGKANLTLCTNYTAHRYDCLAMTLEMPFKDNANAPDAQFGWSPDRSAALGDAVIDAMLTVMDTL